MKPKKLSKPLPRHERELKRQERVANKPPYPKHGGQTVFASKASRSLESEIKNGLDAHRNRSYNC